MFNRDFIVLGDSHGKHLIPGIQAITSGRIENYTSSSYLPFRHFSHDEFKIIPLLCSKKTNGRIDQIVQSDPHSIIVLSFLGPLYLDGTTFDRRFSERLTTLHIEQVTNSVTHARHKEFEQDLRSTRQEISALKRATVITTLDMPELVIENSCHEYPKQWSWQSFILIDAVQDHTPAPCQITRQAYDQRVARLPTPSQKGRGRTTLCFII